jgi:hypothetical protein
LASTTKKIRSASAMAISVCARMRPCQRLRGRILEAGGVDNVEDQIVELRGVHAPVAGDARRVVDERELAPARRLKSVDLPTLGRPMMATLKLISDHDASPEPRISSTIIVARSRLLRGAVGSAAICSKSFSASAARASFQADRPSASRAEWRSGLVSAVSVSTRAGRRPHTRRCRPG